MATTKNTAVAAIKIASNMAMLSSYLRTNKNRADEIRFSPRTSCVPTTRQNRPSHCSDRFSVRLARHGQRSHGNHRIPLQPTHQIHHLTKTTQLTTHLSHPSRPASG